MRSVRWKVQRIVEINVFSLGAEYLGGKFFGEVRGIGWRQQFRW